MTELRLASWNLLHGRSLSHGQVHEDELREGAKRLDADVVALQEVDRAQSRSGGTDQTAAVAEATGAAWWKFVPALWGLPGQAWEPAVTEHDQSRDRPAYGVGFVSRLPVLDWDVLRFPAAPVGMPLLVPGRGMVQVDDEPRIAISAVVSGPRGPFTVVATHLSFVPGFNVRQLRHVTRWAAAKPAPQLLLGDLNLPGRLPAWISGWSQLAQVATYPSWKPRVQLDHALGQGIAPGQVISVESERLPVSDHNALAVTVTL